MNQHARRQCGQGEVKVLVAKGSALMKLLMLSW
jgi:hypothetical protein